MAPLSKILFLIFLRYKLKICWVALHVTTQKIFSRTLEAPKKNDGGKISQTVRFTIGKILSHLLHVDFFYISSSVCVGHAASPIKVVKGDLVSCGLWHIARYPIFMCARP